MKTKDRPQIMDRKLAESYAACFKALADGTRIQVMSLLAARNEPLTVGEITEGIGVGQSTVSHHLKILGEVGFVQAEPSGTSNLYRMNPECVECFPTIDDVLAGSSVPAVILSKNPRLAAR